MAQNRRSEGVLLTIEATAASNIVAGTPVAIGTALGGSHLVYTLGVSPVNLSGTGKELGHRFIGVLDESVSAMDCPITIWTEGIFRFQVSTANATGNAFQFVPAGPDSGMSILYGDAAFLTAGACIGTVLGVQNAEASSQGYVDVRITPAVWRWTIYNANDLTAVAPQALCWPADKGYG